ncbi:MAG TPA: ATP-dependent DNA ligase [Candidatus Xenobia bacterium]|jgi:ATP-dependent DNA ligase
MNLPLQPPVEPMLANLSRDMPIGETWLYEPKWDGFRTVVFWDGQDMLLQSRDQKPLGRYFPELEKGLREVLPPGCVLDGEIVIVGPHGLDFDALSLRIHPAESRVRMLAADMPSSLVAFDLLCADGEDLSGQPQGLRRERLEAFLSPRPPLFLTPATRDPDMARQWFERFEGAGLDGVVAKDVRQPYAPGRRIMVKVKHQRTADCVVGGFRWLRGHEGKAVGSLLLGLYDDDGVLHHVGHTSSFKAAEKQALVGRLEPYRDPTGSASYGSGRTPGGPSRWRSDVDQQWESLRPELVCEVAFEHLQGDRFRHAATFSRWRPDKPPRDCNYHQLEATVPYLLDDIFKAGTGQTT